MTTCQHRLTNLFAQQVSIETVEKWLTELFELVGELDEMPKRFAVDEIQTERAGYEVRKLNFGRYLIFYRIYESERVVELIHLRHGARSRGDI